MTFEALTPKLFRAALGLAGMNLTEFCKECGFTKAHLSNFQNAKGSPLSDKSVKKIRQFFYNRGVEIQQNGVSYVVGVQELYGQDGFRRLYDHIYECAKEGGDIRVYHGVSKQVVDALGADFVNMHIERMSKIADKINSRTIVKDGDEVFFGRKYSHYRTMAPELFSKRTMFIYAGNVAFVNLSVSETYVQLNRSEEMAEMCAGLFDMAWEHHGKEIPDDKFNKA